MGYHFLIGSNILPLMVVQEQVAVLEFSQEKTSACHSTLPSCSQHTPDGVDLDKVENIPSTVLWCISWKEGRKGGGIKGNSEGIATKVVGKSTHGDILGAKDETKTSISSCGFIQMQVIDNLD